MAGIFTRPKLAEILSDENLSTDERVDRIMSMRGRDLDDGYVAKSAAKAAVDTALESAKAEWEKSIPVPNIKESEEYKALQRQMEDQAARYAAKDSEDFKGVKPKFFDAVYGMIERGDQARPVSEQIAGIREKFEEYFDIPAETKAGEQPKPNTPIFSQEQGRTGTNPTSEEDALYEQIVKNWK